MWLGDEPKRLIYEAMRLIEEASALSFNVASMWGVVLKNSLGSVDFAIVQQRFYEGLVRNGHRELVVSSYHALGVGLLPKIHKDPFDRILVAHAHVEDITLLSMDRVVSQYPGPIRYVH